MPLNYRLKDSDLNLDKNSNPEVGNSRTTKPIINLNYEIMNNYLNTKIDIKQLKKG